MIGRHRKTGGLVNQFGYPAQGHPESLGRMLSRAEERKFAAITASLSAGGYQAQPEDPEGEK